MTKFAILLAALAACDASSSPTPSPAPSSSPPAAPDTTAILRGFEQRADEQPVPDLPQLKRADLIAQLRSLQSDGFSKPEYKPGDKVSAEACGAATLELRPRAKALLFAAASTNEPAVLEAANYAHECTRCELGLRPCLRADELLDVLQR